MNQDKDKCESNLQVHVRVHHRNNALFSLGVENWSPCQLLSWCSGSALPSVASAFASYGKELEGVNVSFNAFAHYNLANSFLPYWTFFLKAVKGNFTWLFQANLNREVVENKENNESTQTVNNSVDLVFRFIKTLNNNTSFWWNLNYDMTSKKTDATFVASHQLDKVKLNAKLQTDNSLTVGLTSTNNDVTLNFVAKSTLQWALEKVGEKETLKKWVGYKFWLSAEFNRL